jgi:hypothetical protein
MQIKPIESLDIRHVRTGRPLKAKSVIMPGYRCFAEVEFDSGHTGFADLPLGNHVYHPQLWDRQTNEVVSNTSFLWTDIREEWRQEHDEPSHWKIVTRKAVRKAFVLNCLDFIYGHCLSRLLNYSVDHATRFPGLDCILMVPEQLAHLAPEGCAEIWIYSGPLKNLRFRNLWLERAFADLYARMDVLYLSPCPLHNPDQVNPRDFGLEVAKSDSPAIVFSYRENRAWGGNIYNQRARLEKLGELLSSIWPPEQLYLVGVAKKSVPWKWKHWNSLLVTRPTVQDERVMLAKLSQAVISIGCQGSNMLLPCMLSWSTIRLLPLDRLSHFLGGDYVGRAGSQQVETLYKSRILYGGYELRDLAPATVFEIAKSMLEYREFLQARFIEPVVTPDNIRNAARNLPSEEKLAAHHAQSPAWSDRNLALARKLRNRFEKIVGRLRWLNQ